MTDQPDSIPSSTAEINDIESANLKDRTGYLVGLDHTLDSLKDFGEKVAGIDMTKSEYSTSLFMVFQGVYHVLGASKLSYGDEFRTVNGLHLWEIAAIDTKAIGINTVVPKNLDQNEPAVVVGLEELDDLRLTELQNIANSANGDPNKIGLVKKTIEECGGIKTDPIFEKKKENIIYL